MLLTGSQPHDEVQSCSWQVQLVHQLPYVQAWPRCPATFCAHAMLAGQRTLNMQFD